VGNFELNPEDSMQLLIQGCKNNDRESQRLLYQHYYGYAMSICLRYCRSLEESKEVVNDGFMKVFQRIEQHKPESSFKGWIRKIMINVAIDHYRKELKHSFHADVQQAALIEENTTGVLEDMSYNELLGLIQNLSPGYRAVFNLYVIDGFKHEEIAQILNISSGTSKSNLMKARAILKERIGKLNSRELYAKYV
jgi:RNA polymerase sigma factor (sigma-70 family)